MGSIPVVVGVSDLPFQGPVLRGRWPVTFSPPYLGPVYSSPLSGLGAPLRNGDFGQKNGNISYPLYLTPPQRGFQLQFCNAVSALKSRMMGHMSMLYDNSYHRFLPCNH